MASRQMHGKLTSPSTCCHPVACTSTFVLVGDLLAISNVRSYCEYDSVHRADADCPGGDITHGLRNAMSERTDDVPRAQKASAASTYPTPGSKMFPPTTWCENSAFARGVSAIGEVIVSSDQAPLYKRNCSQDDVTRILRRATGARARYSERPLAPCVDHV